MGVVRDWITSDAPATAEWVARKLHNHNPMRVRAQQRGSAVQKTRLALDFRRRGGSWPGGGTGRNVTMLRDGHDR